MKTPHAVDAVLILPVYPSEVVPRIPRRTFVVILYAREQTSKMLYQVLGIPIMRGTMLNECIYNSKEGLEIDVSMPDYDTQTSRL